MRMLIRLGVTIKTMVNIGAKIRMKRRIKIRINSYVYIQGKGVCKTTHTYAHIRLYALTLCADLLHQALCAIILRTRLHKETDMLRLPYIYKSLYLSEICLFIIYVHK